MKYKPKTENIKKLKEYLAKYNKTKQKVLYKYGINN